MSFPRYPKYKASGVEWLAEVPESWEVRRIKHLGKTITGGTPKTEEPEYWTDGDVPWLPSGKVQNNSIHKEDADTFITKRALAESAAKLIRPGSALIALTGATCANAAFLTFESTANQSVVGIEPKLNADGRFIYYSLLSQREQVLTHKSGGAQGGINQEDVRNLVITAPAIAEQTAIAEFLDRETGKIDGLVAEQRRLMELLKEKRQAVISHAVTKGLNPHAPMKPSGIEWLGDVPEHWDCVRNKVIFEEISERSVSDEGELMTVSHITGVSPRSSKDVNMFLAETLEGYKKCRRGDLVINTMWAWMGALGCSPCDGLVSPAYNIYRPRSAKRLSPAYYDYLCRLPAHVVTMKANSTGVWESRLRLYPTAFLSMRLPVPPLEEQLSIIEYLNIQSERWDTLTAEAQRAIDFLQERRTALISAAVTGQIDVRQHPKN
jgi:type I restriction enzyme S subunit